MRRVLFHSTFFLLSVTAIPLFGNAQAANHADRMASYEGAKTCLACHPEAGREVAASLHYQQQAEPRLVKDWPQGESAGMMVSY